MSGRRRRGPDWRAIVGILLSIGFLWYALRGVDLHAVLRQIRQADPWLFLLAVAAATFPFWIRAWRWRSLLRPVYPATSFRARFAAVNIGFMANNLLPARVGEILRAYVVSRLEPIPVVSSLGSLVVERIFDGTTLVAFTFLALAFPGFPETGATGRELHAIATTLATVFAIAGVVFLAMVLFPRQVVRGIERLVERVLPLSFRRPIVDGLEALLSGLAAIRRPLLLARIIFWSVVLWGFGALSYWLAMRAFHIDVPFMGAVFLQSVISFSVALPSSPGFFGIYEAAVRVGLVNVWHVDPNRALGLAIGFHLGGFVPVTVMGLVYAARLGFSWREVRSGESIVETAVEYETGHDPAHPDRP